MFLEVLFEILFAFELAHQFMRHDETLLRALGQEDVLPLLGHLSNVL